MSDTEDKRNGRKDDQHVLVLGVVVLAVWALLSALTLLGLYHMLVGGIKITDAGIVATVFTVLGTMVGYISNSAQQVLSYYFGSSRGSQQKTTAMAEAISNNSRADST